MAKAFGHAACRKGLTTVYYKFNKLFAEFAKANGAGRLEKLLEKLGSVDLFILDDYAFRKIDQPASEWLYAASCLSNDINGGTPAKAMVV